MHVSHAILPDFFSFINRLQKVLFGTIKELLQKGQIKLSIQSVQLIGYCTIFHMGCTQYLSIFCITYTKLCLDASLSKFCMTICLYTDIRYHRKAISLIKDTMPLCYFEVVQCTIGCKKKYTAHILLYENCRRFPRHGW